MERSMVTKESNYGRQYKEYTTGQEEGRNAKIGAQVLGGELWYN
ncbi:hypothetical protein SAMN05216463_1307 [Xylanibacter ruminicola]|uniref:Uncharacterized protein n=1 Tax=Xylanibacter ruminicola TaxID=839 RepID=A0A1M6YND4_XYLRU|nr:hypothetical protein SAMN05216463_1307 [Xylanibacter ruminicola]